MSGHPRVARLLSEGHKEYVVPEEEKVVGWFERWIVKVSYIPDSRALKVPLLSHAE